LIFMDLNMPVMDGIECVRHLREMERDGGIELCRTQIIGVSAISEELFNQKQGSHLFEGYREKPLSKEVILEILSRADFMS